MPYFRLKSHAHLNTPSTDWIEHGAVYEGAWDESYPPKSPPDVWIHHPEDSKSNVKLPSHLFEEVPTPEGS